MTTFRVVGYDYDYHICNELGKRISSGSGQAHRAVDATERADDEFMRVDGHHLVISISKVIEVEE